MKTHPLYILNIIRKLGREGPLRLEDKGFHPLAEDVEYLLKENYIREHEELMRSNDKIIKAPFKLYSLAPNGIIIYREELNLKRTEEQLRITKLGLILSMIAIILTIISLVK